MTVTKNTIVIWDGIIMATPGAGLFHVTWSGTVFVHESAPDPSKVPEPRRQGGGFDCQSDKTFEVSGIARPVDGIGNGDLFKKYAIEFTDGDGWELVAGDSKVKDIKHVVMTSLQWRGSPNVRDSLCFAQGQDQFGAFISTGYMKPGNRVTLARRYVESSDPKAKWTVHVVRNEIVKAVDKEEEEQDDSFQMPPWKVDVLKAH